ncbi:MAG: hypothetical protein SFV51_22650 [Bryobacteraceae bacterium]|nr:hypothetical protein [Bryobacteraceae bacterium]
MPAEIERECYRLATELGLNPPDRVEILEKLQARWRRQLRQQWQREMLDIGMLLVRQHGLISFLQCHPTSPTRPELCFILDQIRADLTRLLRRYKLTESLSKLPELPLPGAPESWMTWSGDELRASVLKELGAPEE